ncbi:uncharacterized protein LOC143304036 [Bombus vancouverensis nearcticus]|uniref:uncharacterized protein LOC143304036 n=1 Tax=Bombus vancouverensis nearcticus TaxID=2705178 RepID=UPI00402B5B9D
MERKLYKEELEAFQEVLDKYEEGGSVTVIQYQEAAIAIASLENTAMNYPIVWEILEKQYNQLGKIVANHLKALFDVSSLQRPSYQDHDTQLRWKEHITRTDHTTFPNVGQLFDFLHSRCNLLEAIGSTYQTPSRPTTRPYSLRIMSQSGMCKRMPKSPIT